MPLEVLSSNDSREIVNIYSTFKSFRYPVEYVFKKSVRKGKFSVIHCLYPSLFTTMSDTDC